MPFPYRLGWALAAEGPSAARAPSTRAGLREFGFAVSRHAAGLGHSMYFGVVWASDGYFICSLFLPMLQLQVC